MKSVVNVLLRATGTEDGTRLSALAADREVQGGRLIHAVDREGHGQLTGWVSLSCEHISHRVTTLLTRLPSHQDSIGHLLPGSGLDGITHVQDDNHLLAFHVESVADIRQHLTLLGCQVEIIVDGTVASLTSLTAQGYDSHLCLLRLQVDDTTLYLHLWKHRLTQNATQATPIGQNLVLLVGLVGRIKVGQRLCRLQAHIA